MKDPDFKCCKCAKHKEFSHDELWYFGNFGNNPFKVNDNNSYCEKHFEEMDLFYERKLVKNPIQHYDEI